MTLPTATLRTLNATAPLYGLYQQDFDLTSVATNRHLPYDGTAHADAAHLAPVEDATLGLALRVVVTDPQGATEGDAGGWPAYWEEEYVFTPVRPGEEVDNYYPTGDTHGRFRYAFQKVGAYSLSLYLYDAGAPTGQLCATWGVTVSDTGLPGRVRPCAAAPTRLQTQRQVATGEALTLLAHKADDTNSQGYAPTGAAIAAAAAGGAAAAVLQRLWIGSLSGAAVFGGVHFDGGGGGATKSAVSGYGGSGVGYTPVGPLAHNAQGGRFWFTLAAGEQWDVHVPVKANTAYTITFQVAVQGADAPTGAGATVWAQTMKLPGFVNIRTGTPVTLAAVPPATLTPVTVTLPAMDPYGDGSHYIARALLGTTGLTGGKLYLGGLTVTDPAGADVYLQGDFSWHAKPNRRTSADLDVLLAGAEARGGEYFRLLMFEKTDGGFGQVQADGTGVHDNSGTNEERTYGISIESEADLPVRRWHRQAAEYLVARWGYSHALAMVEFVNESATFFDGNHAAGAQNLGAALHRWLPGLPVGSSHGFNSGGVNYDIALCEGGIRQGVTVGGVAPLHLPDVTLSDLHDYNGDTGGVPLNELGGLTQQGWSWAAGAGPAGESTLAITAASAAPWLNVPFGMQAYLTALRWQGAGAWTISYSLKGSGGLRADAPFDVQFQPLNGGAFLHATADVDAAGAPIPFTADTGGWRRVSKTFTVPDGQFYTTGDVQALRVGPGNLRAGRYDLYDLQVRDPQGRLWYRFATDENHIDDDQVSWALSIARMYAGYQALGLTHPFTLGEAALEDQRHLVKAGTTWTGSAGDPNLLTNSLWVDDTAGWAAQDLAWANLATGGTLPIYWDPVVAYLLRVGYRSAVACAAMCAGGRLGSGTHLLAEFTVSDRALMADGTWDATNMIGLFLLRNRTGHAMNRVYHPASVGAVSATATLTGNGLAGVPDGLYALEYWPTDAPHLVGGVAAPLSRTTATASGGRLPIPVTGLSSRVGVKVSAVGGAVTAVAPSPEAAAVPGGQTLQLTATVLGTGAFTQTVTWGGPHVSPGGLFTAPAATGDDQVFVVTVASADDPTVTATVTVVVPAAGPVPAPGTPWLTYLRRFRLLH